MRLIMTYRHKDQSILQTLPYEIGSSNMYLHILQRDMIKKIQNHNIPDLKDIVFMGYKVDRDFDENDDFWYQ